MQVNRFIFRAILIALSLFATSCVDKFWPELDNDNSQFLVVDGKISNFPGPYTVKLSYSSSILDTLFIPNTAATITILDNQGNQEVLTMVSPGVYKTSPSGIQGIIGHDYKIEIELDNGLIYESEYEELLNPIVIEDVHFEKEWRYAQNILETDQEGLQFYVNSEPSESSKAYFFWEIEETYEYHAPYRIYFMYNGPENNDSWIDDVPIKKIRNVDTLYYCWKTQNLKERLIYKVESSNEGNTSNLPIHFVPNNDERLRWGYNILVKQYTISEKLYTFLNYLKKQNENQGGLFTSQPFQIRSNISNIQDPSEEVLGYFKVASGTIGPRIQARASGGLFYDKPICYYDTAVSSIKHRIVTSQSDDWPIFLSYFHFDNDSDPLLGPILIFAYIAPNCLDCRNHGGVTRKPEFWQW